MVLRIGSAAVRLEQTIVRCRLINHHPDTGRLDADVLPSLGAGVTLGWGAEVVQPGVVRADDEVRIDGAEEPRVARGR